MKLLLLLFLCSTFPCILRSDSIIKFTTKQPRIQDFYGSNTNFYEMNEDNPSYKDLFSEFDTTVQDWIKRKDNILYPNLRNALQDPKLFNTFIKPPIQSFKEANEFQVFRGCFNCETKGCYYIHGDLEGQVYLICTSPNLTVIPQLPEFLDVFELSSTQVTTVQSHAFKNVRVKAIKLNQNQIKEIHDDAFVGISDTRAIQINYNKLKKFSFKTFKGMDKLMSLQLDFNEISFMHKELSEETLKLEEPVEFPMLMSLSLKQNPLGRIPGNLFKPLQNSLINLLVLENCDLRFIHPDSFKYLPHLAILDLSSNPKVMPSLAKSLTNMTLTQIKVANNALLTPPKDVLSILSPTLSTLDLRRNNPMTITKDSFPLLPKLRNLHLVGCGLTSLAEDVFSGMPNLEVLMISENNFRQIPSSFNLLQNIKILDLSGNTIDSDISNPHGKLPIKIPHGSFKDLKSLKSLDLSRTWIEKLELGTFKGLHNLGMLQLSYCRIRDIQNYALSDIPFLQILNLSGNPSLRTSLKAKTFAGLHYLKTLYLNSSGIEFPQSRNNTQFKEFENKIEDIGSVYGKNSTTITNGSRLVINDGNIYLPFEHLIRLEFLYLTDNKLQDLHPQIFESMSLLHTLELSGNNLESWNQPMFSKNPKLREIILSRNNFHSITEAMIKDFSSYSNTTHKYIDISQNTLQCDRGSCDLKFGHENNTFTLKNYKVHGLYECRNIYGNYEKIQIKNLTNEFCEVFNIQPPTSTVTEDIEDEMNKTTTIDETWKNINDESTVNSRNPMVKIFIVIFGVLLGLTGVGLLVYKQRTQLYVFCFGMRLSWLKQIYGKTKLSPNEDGKSYLYDVFISFAHHDADFIQDILVPQLEGNGKILEKEDSFSGLSLEFLIPESKDMDSSSTIGSNCSSTISIIPNEYKNSTCLNYPLKICLHLRDFQVGVPITENIIEAVDNSRKILIVLSEKYLESQWCAFELNLAYHRLIEFRRSSLILLLLHPIPNSKKSKLVSHLMNSRTYLEWPHEINNQTQIKRKIFWKRLAETLRNKENNQY